MSHKILEQHFALGLYTYLVQAELSTDRVLGHPWNMLCQFYKSEERIMPHKVITVIAPFLSLNTTLNGDIILKKYSSKLLSLSRIRQIWNWQLRKRVVLNEDEFLFIFQTLMEFDRLLLMNPGPEKIGSLRQNLYLSGIILKRQMPFCLADARKVEHLNQNEYLTCLKFSEIVGETQINWLQSWYRNSESFRMPIEKFWAPISALKK